MAKKRALFNEQYDIVRSNLTKRFYFTVYQGLTQATASYLDETKQLNVKAFRIVVEERWFRDSVELFYDKADFGYVTSRSSDVAHALSQMKMRGSLVDMRVVMNGLKMDFRAVLERDAYRELKKLLGKSKPVSPIFSQKQRRKPLPQIQLPWDSEK